MVNKSLRISLPVGWFYYTYRTQNISQQKPFGILVLFRNQTNYGNRKLYYYYSNIFICNGLSFKSPARANIHITGFYMWKLSRKIFKQGGIRMKWFRPVSKEIQVWISQWFKKKNVGLQEKLLDTSLLYLKVRFFFTKPHCYYFVVPFYACQFVSDFQIVLQKLRVLWQQKRILTLCDIQKGPQRFQWETTYYQSVITFWTN